MERRIGWRHLQTACQNVGGIQPNIVVSAVMMEQAAAVAETTLQITPVHGEPLGAERGVGELLRQFLARFVEGLRRIASVLESLVE